MSEDEIRTVEIHGQLYEMRSHDSGIAVQVIGTTYEIYENNRGGFEVNRVEGDGAVNCIGEGLSSESAAIELAEIYERLLLFVLDNGYMSQLSIIEWSLEKWKREPPRRI